MTNLFLISHLCMTSQVCIPDFSLCLSLRPNRALFKFFLATFHFHINTFQIPVGSEEILRGVGSASEVCTTGQIIARGQGSGPQWCLRPYSGHDGIVNRNAKVE